MRMETNALTPVSPRLDFAEMVSLTMANSAIREAKARSVQINALSAFAEIKSSMGLPAKNVIREAKALFATETVLSLFAAMAF